MSQDLSNVHGMIAGFETPKELVDASKKIRDAGFKHWETYTPFPVHGIEKAMGIKDTFLPWIVLVMGLKGLTVGLILQAFANGLEWDFYFTGFEYIVSGKNAIYAPTMVPVAFELTILLSAFGAIFGMLALNKLPMYYHPTFKHEDFARVTDDRFFVVIESTDNRYDSETVRKLLEEVGGENIQELEK